MNHWKAVCMKTCKHGLEGDRRKSTLKLQMRCLMDTITWELSPVKHDPPAGPRQAVFYTVKHQETTYRVMLGINELGHYDLLEHLVKDETLPHGYPYRPLPYLEERWKSGEGLFQFETIEQVIAFVEEQVHEWEDTQQKQ